MAENQKLTTEELGALQVLNTNFQNTKIKIAECELQKVKLIAELDAFRKDFASMEKELINKYGDKVHPWHIPVLCDFHSDSSPSTSILNLGFL